MTFEILRGAPFLARPTRSVLAAMCMLTTMAACLAQSAGGGSLTIGVPTKSAPYTAIFLGSKDKLFQKAGSNLAEPVILGSGAKTAAALVGGAVDVAIGGITEVVNLKAAGQDVRILGSVFPTFTVDIVASSKIQLPQNAALKDRVLALKGKTVGITGPGSGSEALIAYLFNGVGLDYKKDVTLVSVGGDLPASLGALQAGRIDAVSHAFGIGQLAESKGIGKFLISPSRGDVPDLETVLHQVAYTLGPKLKEKPAELSAFIRGLATTYRVMHDDQARLVNFVQSEYGLDRKAAELLSGVVAKVTPQDPTIDVAKAEKGFKQNLAVGASIDKSIVAPSLSSLVATDFITQAMAKR